MVAESSEILTTVPESFLREFESEIMGRIPAEKVKIQLEQAKWARVMAAEGSCRLDGLGQRAAVIDRRLFFRWLHENQHAPVHEWLDDLLADNPDMVSKGYTPKRSGARHGFTYVGGEAVSGPKGRVQK